MNDKDYSSQRGHIVKEFRICKGTLLIITKRAYSLLAMSPEDNTRLANQGHTWINVDQLNPAEFRFTESLLYFEPVDVMAAGPFENTWRETHTELLTIQVFIYGFPDNDSSSAVFGAIELEYNPLNHAFVLRQKSRTERCPY